MAAHKIACKNTPFKVISPPVRIVDIASGDDHVLMLTADGEIYSLGACKSGQLGRLAKELLQVMQVYTFQHLIMTPLMVTFSESYLRFDRIWASLKSSFARSTCGHIYAWGDNPKNKLGFNSFEEAQYYPRKVDALAALLNENPSNKIIEISSGDAHTITLDSNGLIYVYGTDLRQPLTQEDAEQPTRICCANGNEKIISIAAGFNSSFAVCQHGKGKNFSLDI